MVCSAKQKQMKWNRVLNVRVERETKTILLSLCDPHSPRTCMVCSATTPADAGWTRKQQNSVTVGSSMLQMRPANPLASNVVRWHALASIHDLVEFEKRGHPLVCAGNTTHP
eukprot:4803668-Amphidinium_carterae.3